MNTETTSVIELFEFFSVQTLLSLCLCDGFLRGILNHRDTENAELSQRKPKLVHYRASKAVAKIVQCELPNLLDLQRANSRQK